MYKSTVVVVYKDDHVIGCFFKTCQLKTSTQQNRVGLCAKKYQPGVEYQVPWGGALPLYP